MFKQISIFSALVFVLCFLVLPASASDLQKCCVSECVPVQVCGLFGPSKKELLMQSNCIARDSNQTLHRMEIEQARQTELLRQIAGQTARAAEATQRAAINSDRALDWAQKRASEDLRSVPEGRGNTSRDLRNVQELPPTVSPNLQSVPEGRGNTSPSLRDVPEPTGPILQGTSGRVYYVKSAAK